MPLDTTGTTHAAHSHSAQRTPAREAAALAWHIAATAKRTATADATKRTREAIGCGVLFDHKTSPREPGYEGVVYSGSGVLISVKVGQPGTALDVEAFLISLADEGVKPALINRLVKRHRSATGAPHTFSSALVA